MNFHRRWKGDDGIYFGYRFLFHCLYEQNGLFLEAFFTPMAFLEYNDTILNLSPESVDLRRSRTLCHISNGV